MRSALRFSASIVSSGNQTSQDIWQAEFGDIESVRQLADETVAAIMLEPIQSMAGVRMAAPEFYRELARAV